MTKKKHIHTWNDYKDGKLCCSTCGMLYNKYLQEDKELKEEKILKEMDYTEKELNKRLKEKSKRDRKIMNSIEFFGERIKKQIEEEIEESEGGWNLKIVDKPCGESKGDLLDGREVWVNQTYNGENEFEGEVYFKLPNNKWLKWDYSM